MHQVLNYLTIQVLKIRRRHLLTGRCGVYHHVVLRVRQAFIPAAIAIYHLAIAANCNTGIIFLDQAFSATIGNIYNISYRLLASGGGGAGIVTNHVFVDVK